MSEWSGRRSAIGIGMTVFGGFVVLCAAGGMLAFRSMVRRYPDLAVTGPWGRAGTSSPGPVGDTIRFLSGHFWTAVSVQLGVGAVLLLVGLLLIWTSRRATST